MAQVKDNSVGAMRDIHKLLLNTPYGRLGMNNDRNVVKKVSAIEFEKIELKYNVLSCFKLDNGNFFVRYTKYPDPIKCEQNELDFNEQVLSVEDNYSVNNSTAIAAAVTSWARILMYPHIINSHYTDTDSIFIQKPLDNNVGKKLGQFKLEYGGRISLALFISPKLYMLELNDGKLISKTKGFSGKLTKFDYFKLYEGNVLELNNERWRRYLNLNMIKSVNQVIALNGNYDKRNLLYSLGSWVSTYPLFVNNKIIMPTDIVLYTNNTNIVNYKKNNYIIP